MAVELTEKQEDDIVRMITEAKQQIDSARSRELRKIRKYRRQREARPEFDGPKNNPYPNSSNVSVPLSMLIGNTAFAKTEQTFDSKDPFWAVKSTMQGESAEAQYDRRVANVIEKYMNMISESPFDLDLEQRRRVINYESTTLGLCTALVPWTRDEWTFKRTDQETGAVEDVRIKLHDGPNIEPLEYEDVYVPDDFEDISKAPYIFHELHLPWHTIEERGHDGIYTNWEALEGHGEEYTQEEDIEEKRRQGIDPMPSIPLFHLEHGYVYYDVDGDGYVEDLEFTMHTRTGTLLRIDYNMLGIRPFVDFTYLFRPHYRRGMGTGWITEHMQDEVDATHNMRIDNMKIANMRIFVAKRDVGVGIKEKIYPGKILWLDNPREDFQAFQAGEVYPSSLQAEQMAMSYAQRASGMSDIMAGFADSTAKTRDTVGMQTQRLQEGRGIHGSILGSMAKAYSRLGMIIFFQLVRNRDVVLENERQIRRLNDEEIELLREALSIGVEEIPIRLRWEVRTSDPEEAFEVKRQNFLTLSQLYSMYFQQIFPIVQQMGDQELLRELMSKAFTGQTKLMENIFKLFGEEETQEYLPGTAKQELLQEVLAIMQGRFVEMERTMEERRRNEQQGPVEQRQLPTGRPGGAGAAEAGVTGSAPPNAGMAGGAQDLAGLTGAIQ